MDLRRILTAVIGLPIVILILIFGNKYIMDVVIALICIMSLNEYSKCIHNEAKFSKLLGYIIALCIAFIHVIPEALLIWSLFLGIPLVLLILFSKVILTNMKFSFKDLAFSFTGIIYIVAFAGFIPLLYGFESKISGKFLIWFLLTCSWGCDSLAFIVGKKCGKRKFSKVSPNKSIEGCLGGTIGAIVLSLICAIIINSCFNKEISYLAIIIISIILSIIGQIGDFSASAIKRYFEIKDFSDLFPGHGGMLDRIDSVMFIAPFAYFLLTIFV